MADADLVDADACKEWRRFLKKATRQLSTSGEASPEQIRRLERSRKTLGALERRLRKRGPGRYEEVPLSFDALMAVLDQVADVVFEIHREQRGER